MQRALDLQFLLFHFDFLLALSGAELRTLGFRLITAV
jgi:hypothetical protein